LAVQFLCWVENGWQQHGKVSFAELPRPSNG
jgi:hypothetical protein